MRLAVLLLAVSAFGQDLNSISRTASGNIAGANSSCLGYNCVWIAPPPNANAVTVQITGTFSGTVVFEATTTGVSYSSVAATNGDTSATATGTWNFPLYGYRAFRVRGSAYVSGPVVVAIGAASATTAGTGGWTDDGSTITAAAGRDVSISGDVTIGSTVLDGTGIAGPAINTGDLTDFNAKFGRSSSVGTGNRDSFFGVKAGGTGTNSGSGNTCMGYQCLFAVTSAFFTTATGNNALLALTTGEENTCTGAGCLQRLTTGAGNSAFGKDAGNSLGPANLYNTLNGQLAMGYGANGSYNTCTGTGACLYTSQSSNTATGQHALYENVHGTLNVANGQASLYRPVNGIGNIGNGWGADFVAPDSTMTSALSTGSSNLSVGEYCHKVAYNVNGAVFGSLSQNIGLCLTTDASHREITLSNIPIYSGPIAGAVTRKIYRTKVNGQQPPVGSTGGWYLVATIADNSTTTYVDSVADASLGAEYADPSYSILMGYMFDDATDVDHTAYKSNQFVMGSNVAPITEMWLGRGVFNATPSDILLSATGGRGSNVAGASMILSGGPGTGTGASGAVIFKAAAAGSSGSTWNAVSEIARIDGLGMGIGVAPVSGRKLNISTATADGIGVRSLVTGADAPAAFSANSTGSTPNNPVGFMATMANASGNSSAAFNGTVNGANTTNYGLRVDVTGATTNYALYVVAGFSRLNLPTTTVGCPTGALWNDTGTVKVCP